MMCQDPSKIQRVLTLQTLLQRSKRRPRQLQVHKGGIHNTMLLFYSCGLMKLVLHLLRTLCSCALLRWGVPSSAVTMDYRLSVILR